MPDDILDEHIKASILDSDTTFQDVSSFTSIDKLEYGYVSSWIGFDTFDVEEEIQSHSIREQF